MLSSLSTKPSRTWARRTALAVVFAWLAEGACPAEHAFGAPPGKRAVRSAPAHEPPSASWILYAADIEKFRPGSAMDSLLADVNWRGDFLWSCRHEGKTLHAIYYGLIRDRSAKDVERDPLGIQESVYAVFIDNKFVKFVQSRSEVVDTDGTKRSLPKSVKVGDFTWLIDATQCDPVDMAKLQNEVNARPEPPSHVDPGLTVAWLILRPFIHAATEKEYKRNAALRDQLNGARVRIGMREADIQRVFRAKPLERGTVEAGSFAIYGSNEWFNINHWLHFSNILVLYQHGQVAGVCAAPSGGSWREELGQWFSDLPARQP
jgi:hypothetical protein